VSYLVVFGSKNINDERLDRFVEGVLPIMGDAGSLNSDVAGSSNDGLFIVVAMLDNLAADNVRISGASVVLMAGNNTPGRDGKNSGAKLVSLHGGKLAPKIDTAEAPDRCDARRFCGAFKFAHNNEVLRGALAHGCYRGGMVVTDGRAGAEGADQCETEDGVKTDCAKHELSPDENELLILPNEGRTRGHTGKHKGQQVWSRGACFWGSGGAGNRGVGWMNDARVMVLTSGSITS